MNTQLKSQHGGCLGRLVAVAAFLLLILLGAAYLAVPRERTPEQAAAETKRKKNREVYYTARGVIEKSLKAPSTAKWSSLVLDDGTGVAELDGKPGHYIAEGHVDSQNSFGSMLRARWHVELHDTGDGKYIITHARVGDQTLL